MKAAILSAVAATAMALGCRTPSAVAADAVVGQPAPAFSLPDTSGKTADNWSKGKGTDENHDVSKIQVTFRCWYWNLNKKCCHCHKGSHNPCLCNC